MKLYEHNQIAYKAALDLMERVGKAAVIHPTGTGKSFVAFELCEQHPNHTVCWLSPSEYIFRVQRENWEEAGGEYPENIRFYTYAKLLLMEETEMKEINPDYIILDEFHRCGAKMWGQGVQRLLGIFPRIPLLGLSATNIRYLDNQRDMANELFGGSIASEMTLGESIVRGILNPPKYVLSVYSYQKELERYEARIRAIRGKAVRDAAREALETLRRALGMADGMDEMFFKHMPDFSGKYIVFCANHEHMQEMMEKIPEWFGKIDKKPHIYSVYAQEPGAEQSFQKFKEDESRHLKLLFCIDMLNEGIHIEGISGVILLRPTVSPVIYKQQIGRALSASKKKDAVIFDVVLNIENLCSINAVEEEMQVGIGYICAQGKEEEIVNRHFRILDETKDCIRLFRALEGTLSASWDTMYAYAERYYKENNDLEVPKRYRTPEGYSLGQWLDTQRRVYTNKMNGVLTERQIEKLDKIGMRWEGSWEIAWEKHFLEAKRYYEEHGNLLVGAREEVKGASLGRWLAQLRAYKKNHMACLTPERIAALDNIGMIWDISTYLWEQNYAYAEKYYLEHGNLDVQSTFVDENGIRLGAWVSRMRMAKKDAKVTEEQVDRLERIGMIWDSKQEVIWKKAYAAAVKYRKEHGDLRIPVSYVSEDGIHLGKWIRHQKDAYKKGKICYERICKLNQIGMIWEPTLVRTQKQDKPAVSIWMKQYQKAQEFYFLHGHLKIPRNYKGADGRDLGLWIRRQREKQKQGLLDGEQVGLLEEIGMVWNPRNSWEIGFGYAKRYYEAFGNLIVPNAYRSDDGYRVGKWVANQRQAYNYDMRNVDGESGRMSEEPLKRKKRLCNEQIQRLEKIGMVWDVHESQWNLAYLAAEEYYKDHHDLDIPVYYKTESGFGLGNWLRNQRKRKEKLSEEQIQRLDHVGMKWEMYG